MTTKLVQTGGGARSRRAHAGLAALAGPLARIILAMALGSSVAHAADDALPPGPGRDLVYGRCRTCHSLTYLTDSAGIDREQWASVVRSMHRLGMPELPDDTRAKLLDYLAAYLGPHSPKPQEPAAKPSGDGVDGEQLFSDQCASCHQPDGKGVKGQFPPLAGNRDLFLSRDYPVLVMLNGLRGKIDVDGKPFNAEMPSFAFLSDQEVAAIVNYVRSAWGNSGPANFHAEAPDVAAARARALGPGGVQRYRDSLK